MRNNNRIALAIGITIAVIAAVALGLVFLHQPNNTNTTNTADTPAQSALQRNQQNTERKTDATAIVSAVTEYMANNAGEVPQTTQVSGSTGLDICGTVCDDAKSTVHLSYFKPTNVMYRDAARGMTVPNVDTLYIVNGFSCNETDDGIDMTSMSTRTVVVLYDLANGSTTQHACIGT